MKKEGKPLTATAMAIMTQTRQMTATLQVAKHPINPNMSEVLASSVISLSLSHPMDGFSLVSKLGDWKKIGGIQFLGGQAFNFRLKLVFDVYRS